MIGRLSPRLRHTVTLMGVLAAVSGAPAPALAGTAPASAPAITATWSSTADSALDFPTGVQRIGTTNTGSLRIDFDVTPAAAPINGVVGYADGSVPVTDYADFGVAVRLATSGYFDARDGAGYARRADVAYSAGRTYHVRMTVDVPGRSYSVEITAPGGSPVRIADGYAFRFDSPDTNDLGQVGIKSDTANQFRVDNHTITALSHPDGIPPAKRTISVALSGLANAVADAQPGDHIVVRNGSYSSGGRIYLRGTGTFDNPVVVTAETVGGVTVTGSSGFTVEDSSYLVVRGFVFKHGQGDERGMETASSDHLRISRNRFALTNSDGATKWLRLRGGDKIRIDHNRFEGKTTGDSMVLVDPGSDGMIATNTLVDHNYVAGTRSPDSDTNEALRIGVSDVQAQSAHAVVQYNLFYDNAGDAEVISNKSSDNIYRHNTFRSNQGSLVVRHGDRVTVEGNYFLANSGGLRMYGDGNTIVGNYFEGNTGDGVESTLIIGSGSVSADDPYAGAGYDQPNGGVVAFNTLVNNRYHLRVGYGSGSLAPRNMRIGNNILRGASGSLVLYDRSPSGFSWEGNIVYGTSRGDIPSGYRTVDPQLLEGSDSVYRLTSGSPARGAAASSAFYAMVNTDLDGHTRIEVKDTGADEYSTAAPLRQPLTSGDVGP
jgi:poly(beta-D-mannuronate) lyase